jgi:hypothetical protein
MSPLLPRIASSLGLDRSPASASACVSASSPYLQLQQLRGVEAESIGLFTVRGLRRVPRELWPTPRVRD